MTDKCAYPRCRQEPDLQYGPVRLCGEHWRELCDLEDPTWFRRAIGVEVADDGTVESAESTVLSTVTPLPDGLAAGTMDKECMI